MFLLIIKFITLDEEKNRTQGKLDNVQIKWGLKHVIELEEQIFTGQILSPCKDQFSSCHMQMWELVHKEGWAPKNWCFQIMVLEKTWESLELQGN